MEIVKCILFGIALFVSADAANKIIKATRNQDETTEYEKGMYYGALICWVAFYCVN